MTEKEIDILFEEAFNNAQLIPQDSVPHDIQLVLYGLYKQSSFSDTKFQFNQPHDIINAFKLNAWIQVKHLSEQDAKKQYIEIINTLMKERNL
jgi:acyl-CoA-binding protein